jgi:FSR family fosmidomycin resistance protein-like MFS transporter
MTILHIYVGSGWRISIGGAVPVDTEGAASVVLGREPTLSSTTSEGSVPAQPAMPSRTLFPILGAISLCHTMNDLLQALLPAIYPILKGGFDLSFAQIGLLTATYQIMASVLQPVVGYCTDEKPQPYWLPFGMLATLCGILMLAMAPHYAELLAGSAMMGVGTSIFHPESSRIARVASGGRHGLAQSLFQVGGNFGQALGPLAAAFLILPYGRHSLAWFALVAFAGMALLSGLGHWYKSNGYATPRVRRAAGTQPPFTKSQVRRGVSLLILLIFSKYFYVASITNFYMFYLIQRFHLSTQAAQIDLFLFLAATAAGIVGGGLIGDRFGRRFVIWLSIVGVLPFTLALPYVGLEATVVLTIVIGLILSSAFPAIIVYAQELMPGRTGMVAGLFFGFAFGIAGIGAGILGLLADWAGIVTVYKLCAVLPAIGLLAMFLPRVGAKKPA